MEECGNSEFVVVVQTDFESGTENVVPEESLRVKTNDAFTTCVEAPADIIEDVRLVPIGSMSLSSPARGRALIGCVDRARMLPHSEECKLVSFRHDDQEYTILTEWTVEDLSGDTTSAPPNAPETKEHRREHHSKMLIANQDSQSFCIIFVLLLLIGGLFYLFLL